jgi:two-component system, chemotaxis family, sensor kinase CheA
VDALEQIRQTFFQECAELLADLETGLMTLQAGEGDADTVNAVFRAVHSVKGGAGAFGLEDLVGFAHVFENTLDDVRSNRIQADEAVLGVLLRSADLLADLVAVAKGGGQNVDPARSEQLKVDLKACSNGGAAEAPAVAAAPVVPEPQADEFGFVPQTVAFAGLDDFAPAPAAGPQGWVVTFRPHDTLYANANDPIVLLRELERIGPCTMELDVSKLPPLDALEPEKSYLAWTVTVESPCEESKIREVFEFVDGDCDVGISKEDCVVNTPAAAPEPAPLLVLAPVIDLPIKPAAPVVEHAPAQAAAQAEGGKSQAAPTIRVDLERIDRLINLVGELVINQAMLSQRAGENGVPRNSTFGSALDDLEQLTREIQDSVMAIRAQPVKSVFQRMPRLVREVASMTGKQVRLVTEGEATEVDKTVIEQLTDPITHMIRNAIDHGLESPERRAAAGKNPEGVVRLAAVHRSGRIVIEVSDDGGGIDRARVKQIAAKKGLIDADAPMSDEEVDNLIFLPGFSTASEVTNVSGRGVGMDVVRRAIQGIGGRISIASVPGKGSTFTLSLPLTLAVLDGMVVSAGSQTVIAPLTSVVETLRPKANEVKALGPNAFVVAVRDTHVPLIDVGVLLGARQHALNPTNGVCLLVEREGGGAAALLVDSIQGQRQVVIKSLEANYQKVDLIAAATILGDGRVALILDVDAVIESGRREASRVSTPSPMLLAS